MKSSGSGVKSSGKGKVKDAITITGTVERLFFSGPTFSTGKLRRTDEAAHGLSNGDSLISFTAPIALKVHDSIRLHGAWGHHHQYGLQFVAKDVGYNLALDADGLTLWLQKNVNIKGIGPAKGRIIADTFGETFDDVITNNPDAVMRAARLSIEDVNNLRAVWISQRDHKNLVTWLAGLGLSVHEIGVLTEKYGNRTAIILKENPYVIIGAIKRFAFKKVDTMALKAGISKNHAGRIDQGILYCVNEDLQNGNTWIPRDELVNKANRLLELDTLDSTKIIEKAIDGLVESGGLEIRRVRGGDGHEVTGLVDPSMAQMETFIAEQLSGGKRTNPVWQHKRDPWTIGDIRAAYPDLNEQQSVAVLFSLTYAHSLIPGGAGVGKTYTVKSIATIYKSHGHEVTLCAPTGKAARRLTESTGYEASTIHKLLGYDGRTFEYDEHNKLDTDLIVIDEVSMVDSRLAFHLLKAIDMDRTAIVFVGDHHQLPPVGPGNLLRDLVQSGVIPTTILTEVVRQAGVLKANCSEILNGKIAASCKPEPDGNVPWQVVNDFTEAISARLWITSAWEQMLSAYPNMDIIRDLQILGPQHKGDLGIERINIELQRVYQKVRRGFTVELVEPGKRARLYVGDKIIQTQNDYSIGVMNGNIGEILQIKNDRTVVVQFDGFDKPVEVEPDKRINLHLAYALTIHKSQGSEFPFVILIIHKAHSFMHSRNLIYTGATRAKKKLIIVGDRWGVSNSVKNVDAGRRKTLLSELLREK